MHVKFILPHIAPSVTVNNHKKVFSMWNVEHDQLVGGEDHYLNIGQVGLADTKYSNVKIPVAR